MKLLEYEAKALLKKHLLPTPVSTLVKQDSHFPLLQTPVVLKSQVPVGGRGKAGGVLIVQSPDEVPHTVEQLLTLPIKGHLPSTLLAEELLSIEAEHYISLLINRASSSIVAMAHKEGGIEVEEHDQSEFFRKTLTFETVTSVGQELTEYLGYTTHQEQVKMSQLLGSLLTCFIQEDMTMLEIKPLIRTKQQLFICGDAKATLDDAATFRHPEWNFENTPAEANFVELDKNGTVATIANGAGLAMATVDAVADRGLNAANFLDIGGGANEASVLAAFERIMEYPNIKAIVINIFAGITRCDEVAKAIIAAKKQLANLPPLCIRLAGTNYEAAAELLQQENITILPTLEECIEAAHTEVVA